MQRWAHTPHKFVSPWSWISVGRMKRHNVMQEKDTNGGVDTVKFRYSNSLLIICFQLLFWKLGVFLGVLSLLVYLFSLLGAPLWPVPKCLLQMFIFINVAYPGQEIGKGVSQIHLRKHFGTLLGKSFPQEAGPGQSALTLRPPIPTSKQKSLQLLFTVRSSVEFWAKGSFPEKLMVASSILPSL